MAFNPEIQKAQAYLRQLGYDQVDVSGTSKNLAVDGVSGPITEAALSKFREDHNLAADMPLNEMLEKMGEAILNDPENAARTVTQTMAQGNQAGRDAVATMQAVMNLSASFLGLDQEALVIDGSNGPKTRAAYTALTGQPAPNAPAVAAAPQQPAEPPQPPPASTYTSTVIAPASQGPAIHVPPGGETPGIAASEGVVPTIIVDDYSGARADPTPPLPQRTAGAETVSGGADYRLGERGKLSEQHRQEASRTAGPDYDYARPQSAAEMRQQEAQQRRAAEELGRDANRAVRNIGALGDNHRGNDINAIGSLVEMAARRLFSP